ncbi:MAG: hypothetical protein NVS9B3_08710 [Gemmatimonadaceae bacterium]
MHTVAKWLVVPALLVAGACARQDDKKLDDALRNDLSLASSARPYQSQQFASPQELGYGMQPQYGQYQGAPGGYGPPGYPTPVYQPAPVYQPVYQPAPVYRSGPVYRTSSTGRGTVYRYPAEPIRHTKRDAMIGATAGAVIGATASHGDPLKGGLIGAAAGGVLGAIVGHTVDVDRR